MCRAPILGSASSLPQDGVVALLSDLLHEADVQRAAIDQEAAALGKVYANFSQIRGAENGVERTEVIAINLTQYAAEG